MVKVVRFAEWIIVARQESLERLFDRLLAMEQRILDKRRYGPQVQLPRAKVAFSPGKPFADFVPVFSVDG
jgi:hypothetical protein